MLNIYGSVFVFFVAGLLFVYISLAVVKLLAPYRPNPEKNSTYECGEEPVGSGWINFNARFYLIAILFIVFDVEIVLVIPVIVNYRDYILAGNGPVAFTEIFLFVFILFLGLIYAWKNDYLEWLKDVRKHIRVEGKVIRIKELLSEESGKVKKNA